MTQFRDWIFGCYGLGKVPPLQDRTACERLYFWGYLWPRLRRLLGPLPHHHAVPHAAAGSDEPFALESTLALLALGPDPNSQVRLRATSKLLDNLAALADELNKEIESLKP